MKSLLKLSLLAVMVMQLPSLSQAAYLDRELEIAEIETLANTQKVEEYENGKWSKSISGEIRNSLGNPVPKVSVIYNGVEYYTNNVGKFSIPSNGGNSGLLIKKAGYRKIAVAAQPGQLAINLEPLDIKSLYIQTGHLKQGEASAVYKNQMNLLATTELNAMTIDYKGDEGHISQGLKPHIAALKAKGVYTIARIVVFKDRKAPTANPEMGIHDLSGKLWTGKGGDMFLNPMDKRAWDYVIGISKQAVADGFDEIQFDYVRFPTDGNLKNIRWDVVPTVESRSEAIAGFLKKARFELGALGAFVAADVFGDTAFVKGDSGIGQKVETIAPHLDYVCPMVYPSGYNKGYAGVKDPVNQPKDIVEVSVKRYRLRAEQVNEDIIVRPWLQSFKDYSGSGRNYGDFEISEQITGSNNAGGQGFLLWNAGGKYTDAGLKKKKFLGVF